MIEPGRPSKLSETIKSPGASSPGPAGRQASHPYHLTSPHLSLSQLSQMPPSWAARRSPPSGANEASTPRTEMTDISSPIPPIPRRVRPKTIPRGLLPSTQTRRGGGLAAGPLVEKGLFSLGGTHLGRHSPRKLGSK